MNFCLDEKLRTFTFNSKIHNFFILAVALLIFVGVANAEEINLTLESHFGGTIYNVEVYGNYAYVGQGQDLVILDINNPTNPVEVGKVVNPSRVTDIVLSENYAYVAHSNGLMIVNVTSPSAPIINGNYNSDTEVISVSLSGKYAYLTENKKGLSRHKYQQPGITNNSWYSFNP